MGDGEAEAVGGDLSSAETQEVVNEEEVWMLHYLLCCWLRTIKIWAICSNFSWKTVTTFTLAANGVEGLKKVHFVSSDIVVTDQMMPEMSGGDAATYSSGFPDQSHSR